MLLSQRDLSPPKESMLLQSPPFSFTKAFSPLHSAYSDPMEFDPKDFNASGNLTAMPFDIPSDDNIEQDQPSTKAKSKAKSKPSPDHYVKFGAAFQMLFSMILTFFAW